jgi:hypothetical protein
MLGQDHQTEGEWRGQEQTQRAPGQVQNDAAKTIATGDRPALFPQTTGSTTWPVRGSTTANKAMVDNVIVQSLPTAAASALVGPLLELRQCRG